jgi:hypothetical protein
MTFFRVAAIAVLVSTVLASGSPMKESARVAGVGENNALEKCGADPDPRYPRQQILQQLEGILRKSIPKDAKYYGMLQSDWEGKNLRFFVHDLTDPNNIYSDIKLGSKKASSCIRFVENHVYHFSPFFIPFSFNHIAFLDNGELKVFKRLNCEGKGDTIADVVTYLEEKLKAAKDKDEIISRVKDYRKFGTYFTVDDTWVRCEEAVVEAK